MCASFQDNGYLFLTMDGKPRQEITHCIKTVQQELVGSAVSAHAFRRMQATERLAFHYVCLANQMCSKRLKKNGLDKETDDAMCAGRQHTPAVAAK